MLRAGTTLLHFDSGDCVAALLAGKREAARLPCPALKAGQVSRLGLP